MEEIQVGEYAKSTDGFIAKIIEMDEDFIHFDGSIIIGYTGLDNYFGTEQKRFIAKHSFNIKDLIENGDYVELEYYVAKYGKRISRVFEISKIEGWDFIAFENAHCNFTYDLELNKWINGKGYNPKIKSIVTKEQFKSMEYEVK